MNWETIITQAISGVLTAVIAGGIGIIGPSVKRLIKAHTTAKQSAIANNVVDGLSKISESVVSDFNQRIVLDAKKSNGWTPQLAAQTKIDAVEAVKAQGAAFIDLANQSAGDLEPMIGTLIEKAVSNLKK